MPAEYAPQDGVLLVWPVRPGSWGKDPSAAQQAFCEVMPTASRSETVFLLADAAHLEEARDLAGGFARILEIETNDAWARDIGPTFVTNGRDVRGVSWRFNAWGRCGGMVSTPTGRRMTRRQRRFAAATRRGLLRRRGLRAGRRIDLLRRRRHAAGHRSLPCLSRGQKPEPDQTADRTQVTRLSRHRKSALAAARHRRRRDERARGQRLRRLSGPEEILLAWTDDENDPQYPLSRADYDYLLQETDARGRKLTVHKLPIPDHPVRVDRNRTWRTMCSSRARTRGDVGERLAASYVNFYFTNDAVLLPQFGGENAASDAARD